MEIDDFLNIGYRELLVTSFETQMNCLSPKWAINELTACPPWMGHRIQLTEHLDHPLCCTVSWVVGGLFQ